MTTQIIAATMARARVVAEDHDLPRSGWVYIRHGSDLMPHRDTLVDRTWPSHPHADGIDTALHDLIASRQPPALRAGYDAWRTKYRYTDHTERIPSMPIDTASAAHLIMSALMPFLDDDARMVDVRRAANIAADAILGGSVDLDDALAEPWYRGQTVMLANGSGEGCVTEVMQTDGEVHTIQVRWADGSSFKYGPVELVALPPEVQE